MPETTEKATIAKNLKRLKETKTEIADAMTSKGIEVKKSHTFRQYAELIRKIDVTMDDYDPNAADNDYSSYTPDAGAGPADGYSGGPSSYTGAVSYQFVSGRFDSPDDNGKIHYPNGTSKLISEASDADLDRSATADTTSKRDTIQSSRYLMQNLSSFLGDLNKDKAAGKTKPSNTTGKGGWKTFLKDNFGVDITGKTTDECITIVNDLMTSKTTESSTATSEYETLLANSDHGADNNINVGSVQLFNDVVVDINRDDLDPGTIEVSYVDGNGTNIAGPYEVEKGSCAPPYLGVIPKHPTDEELIFSGWNPVPINVQRSMVCKPVFKARKAHSYYDAVYACRSGVAKNILSEKQITDTWAEIVKHPGQYEVGQWRLLPLNNPIEVSIPVVENGQIHYKTGRWDKRTSIFMPTTVSNSIRREQNATGVAKMVLVDKSNGKTTWISLGGIRLSGYNYTSFRQQLDPDAPESDWKYRVVGPLQMDGAIGLDYAHHIGNVQTLAFRYDNKQCYMRTFLNDVLPNAMPIYVRDAIKEVDKLCDAEFSWSTSIKDENDEDEVMPTAIVNRVGEAADGGKTAYGAVKIPLRVWALSQYEVTGSTYNDQYIDWTGVETYVQALHDMGYDNLDTHGDQPVTQNINRYRAGYTYTHYLRSMMTSLSHSITTLNNEQTDVYTIKRYARNGELPYQGNMGSGQRLDCYIPFGFCL